MKSFRANLFTRGCSADPGPVWDLKKVFPICFSVSLTAVHEPYLHWVKNWAELSGRGVLCGRDARAQGGISQSCKKKRIKKKKLTSYCKGPQCWLRNPSRKNEALVRLRENHTAVASSVAAQVPGDQEATPTPARTLHTNRCCYAIKLNHSVLRSIAAAAVRRCLFILTLQRVNAKTKWVNISRRRWRLLGCNSCCTHT